jgi:M6 family metalloprotease-like protein
MKFLAALLLLRQDPLEAEKERLRSKPALTAEEKKGYAVPDAPAARPARRSYALAVLPLGFEDRKAGEADLAELFFGRVAKYFGRASGGRFELRGKVYAPVALDLRRSNFTDAALAGVVKAFLAREGEGILAAFDGLAFVAAGPMGARGTPLWPHQGTVAAGGREADFILVAESMNGREEGVVAHETMHLLGFRDKYDDEKAAVGAACILGTGYALDPPAPPCADCRQKLGWTAVAPVDPRRPARLVLPPGPAVAVKVPLNADASEYLLLETREDLMVWHVGGGKRIELVGRYPSTASDRLTPLSDPPFRGRTAGAWPVWLTDVRLEDGKAWFHIGSDAALTPLEEWRRSRVGKRLDD